MLMKGLDEVARDGRARGKNKAKRRGLPLMRRGQSEGVVESLMHGGDAPKVRDLFLFDRVPDTRRIKAGLDKQRPPRVENRQG